MTADRPRLLVVDDDQQIRVMLARYLTDHGLSVDVARDGDAMATALERGGFDLVLLDVMMPGKDGFTLCQELRASSNLPVILLTARSDSTDRVVGLELGADDYVAKPFDPRELLARIRALLRRSGAGRYDVTAASSHRYSFAGWTIDIGRRSLLTAKGVQIELTTGEFDLLTAFIHHPQRILTRDQLLDLLHGRTVYNIDRSIDVQVSRLRRKIEVHPEDPLLIKTVRNGGYYFAAPVELAKPL